MLTNTKNTPVEALERHFPMRVLRYRLRQGSGGAFRHPGGEGLAGGQPGALGENWLLPGGEEAWAERLADKCTLRMKAGDVRPMLTPGGGGWGRPAS